MVYERFTMFLTGLRAAACSAYQTRTVGRLDDGRALFGGIRRRPCVPAHALTRTVTESDNMLFSVMTHEPAAAAYRFRLRRRERMGQAAGQLAVHARPDDRHFGQRHDARHHHRQSRHDGNARSRTRSSTATPSVSTTEVVGDARIEVAARSRHRRIRAPRLQPERRPRRQMQPAGDDA